MLFDGLSGNENLKKSLDALESGGRMPHAVIVGGGSALERAKVADHLAKWAVCSGKGERPCGVCKNCKNAAERAHSDVYYAKESGKTKIYNAEEIKNIIRDASIKPNQAERKVFVFEECDRKLPVISQNMILKTLEEPPQDILFILTCENPKLLLETIRSRSSALLLEDEAKRDEAALEIAKEIAERIVSPSEMELLKATFRLDNRFTALEALNALEQIFRDGMAVYFGAKAELNGELAEKLCRKLTKAHFLGLMEITKTAKENIEKNIPLKLVSTWLCAQYRRTVWQK